MTPTFLRHAARHVHYTVADYIEAQLADLDWTTEGSTPFGATALTFQRFPAVTGDPTKAQIAPGTVAITLGNELAPDPQELGGPLTLQEYPIFVDVFMEKDAEAVAVATDVRDILLGRLPGTHRFLDLVDQLTDLPVPGWKIELDDVQRVRPDSVLPVHWHSVHVAANAYFNETVY